MEKQYERRFVEMVKETGGRAYKFTSPGNTGVPDRLVCLPGGHVGFVELKDEGGRLSPMQERQIERLQSLGFKALVLYGGPGFVKRARAVIDEIIWDD